MNATRLAILAAVILLTSCATPGGEQQVSGETYAPSERAMEILPGVWQAQISNNFYQMRVSWNAGNHRFEGYLSGQGGVSQAVGFSIGELVWTAEPTANPDMLYENQKWRYALYGMPAGSRWISGTVNLQYANSSQFTGAAGSFRKVSY